MAIFSYDNINAKKNDYNDDVIDSMYEMCQDMLDVLDEHGGARNRYVKMKEDEAVKHTNMARAYRNAAKNSSGKTADRFDSKAQEYEIKANDATDKIHRYATSGTNNTFPKYSDYVHYPATIVNNRVHFDKHGSKAGKEEFLKDVNKNDKDYGAKPREPGTYKKIQDAKKATVKETCYMILDMLDDID